MRLLLCSRSADKIAKVVVERELRGLQQLLQREASEVLLRLMHGKAGEVLLRGNCDRLSNAEGICGRHGCSCSSSSSRSGCKVGEEVDGRSSCSRLQL
ncbi:hypothetical protein PMAYCL1PPCAC_13728, partial [Pristionchus mayeri]